MPQSKSLCWTWKFDPLRHNPNAKYLGNIGQHPEVKAILANAVDIIKTTAQQLVPVKTGRLKQSIEVTTHDGKFPTAEVSTDVWYAHFVEFGTERQSAEPFFRPAVDESKAAVVSEMETGIQELLEKVTQ